MKIEINVFTVKFRITIKGWEKRAKRKKTVEKTTNLKHGKKDRRKVGSRSHVSVILKSN